MGAGFIGGIVGGLLAGFVALWFGRLEVPRWLRGLMPVVIIPLVASIVASGMLILFLGRPDRRAHGVAQRLADRPHRRQRHRCSA